MILRVFTVTRNEYDLIEDWIVYHANIFGQSNIVVIDNGSDDSRVLDVYDRYGDKIYIIKSSGYSGGQQGEHFTRIMRLFQETSTFLIGLDTDEFLVHKLPNGIDLTPNNILEQFDQIPENCSRAVIRTQIQTASYGCLRCDRPSVELTRFIRTDDYHKMFYRAAQFISTNNGNHNGQTTGGLTCQPNLALLHFHDTGVERNMERCRQIIIGYGYIHPNDDKDSCIAKLKGQNGSGFHRCRQYVNYLETGTFFHRTTHNFETTAFAEHMKELRSTDKYTYRTNITHLA